MKQGSTKEKILFTAVKLFSDKGYENVSMHDIAKMVNIKAASIYNHFPSKHGIRKSMYVFYAQQQQLAAPTLESLLYLVDIEPVQNVLMKLDYRFPPDLQDMLNRILIIASHGICIDEDSESFIHEHLFKFSKSLLLPLVNRMIELKRIEPIDAEAFSYLVTSYAFSAVILSQSRMKIRKEQCHSGLAMIFSLLKSPR